MHSRAPAGMFAAEGDTSAVSGRRRVTASDTDHCSWPDPALPDGIFALVSSHRADWEAGLENQI
jgi:hypothetical protein